MSRNSLDGSLIRLLAFNYVQVACMMISIQDWLVLFGEEVDLVWNSQWSIPKSLYILNRYAPFLDVTLNLYHSLSKSISPEMCRTTYGIFAVSMVLGFSLTEAVMILRVYALYNGSKRILRSLAGLWICVFIASIVLLVFTMRAYIPLSIPGISGCQPQGNANSPYISALFGNLGFLETVIVSITIHRVFYERARYAGASMPALLRTLYLDGILFFLFIIGSSYINLFFISVSFVNPEWTTIFITPTRVFHGLLSCRMLLNLRRVAAGTRSLILPSFEDVIDGSVTRQ